MHSTESRFIIGPEKNVNLQACVWTFQLRKFTGWDIEGVKTVFCACLVCLDTLGYFDGSGSLRQKVDEGRRHNTKSTLPVHMFSCITRSLKIPASVSCARLDPIRYSDMLLLT